MHSSTSSRMRGSQASTRRGVKPRFTIARMPVCTAPSEAIRFRAFRKAEGPARLAQVKRTRAFSDFQLSGGMSSSPPFISTVNMARDEKVSVSLSTCCTSS